MSFESLLEDVSYELSWTSRVFVILSFILPGFWYLFRFQNSIFPLLDIWKIILLSVVYSLPSSFIIYWGIDLPWAKKYLTHHREKHKAKFNEINVIAVKAKTAGVQGVDDFVSNAGFENVKNATSRLITFIASTVVYFAMFFSIGISQIFDFKIKHLFLLVFYLASLFFIICANLLLSLSAKYGQAGK